MRTSNISSIFLREAPCSCVSVRDCAHHVLHKPTAQYLSGVADVSSPCRSTWFTCQELLEKTTDVKLFSRSSVRLVQAEQICIACLKLDIFTLVENIALMTVVNSLTSGQHFIFSKQKKGTQQKYYCIKKAPGYIVSFCCITLRLQRCLYLCDRVYVYTYIVYIWIYRR